MKPFFSYLLFIVPIGLLFRSSTPWEAALFLFAVLLHETGHLFAILLFGYTPKSISLRPVGAVIQVDLRFVPYRKEIVIYLAGPFFNGCGAAVSFFLLRENFDLSLLHFFFCNALLFLLNLLPVQGLDGYNALLDALCLSKERDAAERMLFPLHTGFLFLLLVGSLFLYFETRNLSLMLLCFSLMMEQKTKKATITS